MSAPVAFISHLRVKDLAAYERMAPEVVRRLQAEKPQTLAFLHYLRPPGLPVDHCPFVRRRGGHGPPL
jgi:hypothetical protein